MDFSSIDHSSDSGGDSDNDGEEFPVAVPVASIIARPSHEEADLETDEGDEETSLATDVTPPPQSSRKRSNSDVSEAHPSAALADSARKKTYNDGQPRRPAAKGLTIPFRTIKRIMKLDADIGIIQNDAAIVCTAALELFVKEFATKSLDIAKRKGRNTIKYDDVAEARANNRALSFLDLLMP